MYAIRSYYGLDPKRGLPRFAPKPFSRTEAAKSRRLPASPSSVGTFPAESATSEATVGTSAPQSADVRGNTVVLWADSFTDGLSPDIPASIVRVLEDAGLRVLVTAVV